ncbi:MAG: glycosyltransferase family 25 protein [Elainellaceae cyanobacterium]
MSEAKQASALSGLFQQFDRVYCINLPRSLERRRYIETYFAELGVTHYSFWDATDKTDAVVEDYYQNGLVQTYPPCFRCGEYSCGDDTCNNVLIAPQVATFITYLKLWQEIVRANVGRILVVEDDVKFAPYAEQTSNQLITSDALNTLEFQADNPALLRLGWALCSEHQASDNFEFKPNMVRYSNPCHAITRAMAELLLNSFETITTTVDIYQHQIVAASAKNYTLMPPLAYELSWSLGEFDSLIHPKPIRISYLQEHQPDASEKIQQAQRSLNEHSAHVLYRPLLILGHPRCGSGYSSKLLSSFGLDIGHEKMGKDGISSWMFAADDAHLPYAQDEHAASTHNKYFKYTVHHVRDPRTAIPSIMRDIQHAPIAYRFRQRHIQLAYGVDLDTYSSELEKAVASYIHWNQMISDRGTDLVLRVEDGEAALLTFLQTEQLVDKDVRLQDIQQRPSKDASSNKLYQGRQHKKPTLLRSNWQSIDPGLLAHLNEHCARYGYDEIKLTWLGMLWNLT